MSADVGSAGWLSIAPAGHPPARLHYRMWGDTGPLLLLLHELGGSTWSWEHIAPDLAAGGFRVAAFDQRGSGRSEKTPGRYTMDLLADDLAEVCRALSPGAPVLLGGLAMGAVTGLHFACAHLERVAGLALFSPAAGIDETARHYLVARAGLVEREGMRAAFAASFENAFPADCRAPATVAGYQGQYLANCPAAYAATSRALAGFAGYQRLERVSAPTLLVSGRHDFIWPPAHGETLAGRLGSAHFEIAETGHFPPLQAPEAVGGRLMAFLQTLRRPAAV